MHRVGSRAQKSVGAVLRIRLFICQCLGVSCVIFLSVVLLFFPLPRCMCGFLVRVRRFCSTVYPVFVMICRCVVYSSDPIAMPAAWDDPVVTLECCY